MPAAWPKVFAGLVADADPRVRRRATGLGLTFGDPAARASLRQVLTDAKADLAQRREALAALLAVKDAPLAATLHGLVRDPELGGPAIRGLSAYDDAATPDLLIKAYPSLASSQRRDALNTLAVRKNWARSLLAAVKAGRLPRGDLTADLVRQLRNLKDPELNTEIGRVWGTVRETTGDRARMIAQYKAMLTSKPSRAAEPSRWPGGLRKGLPAVPHAFWCRRPGRARLDGLESGGPGLPALKRARPKRYHRQ